MSWITLGLFSHFLWAFVNVGDKYIVGNKIRFPYAYMMLLAMIGALAVFLIPFVDFFVPNAQTLGVIAVASAIYFFGGFPYIKAMQMEEPTRINIWWSLIPLFSFAIGWTFFGERIQGLELLGFGILVASAFLAAFHISKKGIVFSKAIWLMVLSTAAYAWYAVLAHYLAAQIPFPVLFIWIHMFYGAYAVLLLCFRFFRTPFVESVRQNSSLLFVGIFAIALLDHLGIFLNQWALSLKEASFVFSLEGSQVLFVFGITFFISRFNKKVLGEEFDRKNVLIKLGAMALMFLGIGILSFGG